MAKTPEGAVKSAVTKALDEIGAYYFFPVTGGFGRSGIPDIIGCYNGLFFAIECKAKGAKPTALQLREHNRIKNKGGLVFVIDEHNIDDVYALYEMSKV